MTELKNKLVGGLLFWIDWSLPIGAILIAWALVRYSDYGSTDFWGSAFLLSGFFGIVFAAAWRYDRNDYR